MTTVVLGPGSSSPWTCPAGVTSLEVQNWGEGANGANGSAGTPHTGGTGGTGGEFAQELTVAVTPGNTYVFTIGSGGTGTNPVFTGDSPTVTAPSGAGDS